LREKALPMPRALLRCVHLRHRVLRNGAWQKAEIAKWWPMIKAANVKVD